MSDELERLRAENGRLKRERDRWIAAESAAVHGSVTQGAIMLADIQERDARIAELEAELGRLRAVVRPQCPGCNAPWCACRCVRCKKPASECACALAPPEPKP